MVKTLLLLISVTNFFIMGMFLYKPIKRDVLVVKETRELILGQKITPIEKKVQEPIFVSVAGNPKDGSVYADIMSHSQRTFGDKHGRITNAHETTHWLNTQIKEAHKHEHSKPINAFYVLEGRGVVIEEPNIKLNAVIRFVPESLRSSRCQLYLVDQTRYWNDQPLYIFDEWVAYVNGAKCGLDDIRNGSYREGVTDGVSGCLDFSIFAVGLAMAVEAGDPEYWKTNAQFKAFLIWHLKEAYKAYMAGHRTEQFRFADQDRLLNQLLNSPEGATMRKFIENELEGVWLDQHGDQKYLSTLK